MRKQFILCFSNIRKAKSSSISILVMFIISSLLFAIGLLVLFNFGSFFDKTVEELNTTDIYYLISNDIYDDELESFIKDHENVIDFQKENALWTDITTDMNGEKQEYFITISNASVEREFSKMKLVGDHLPLDSESVYLSLAYKLTKGYDLGDTIDIDLRGKVVSLTVNGFFEDVFFVTQETGLLGIYLNDETFNEFADFLDDDRKIVKVFANLETVNKDIEIEIKEKNGTQTISASSGFSNTMLSLDINLVKTARTMMPSMIAAVLVAFAAIIGVVCLLVVRFSIGNSIEDDMTKIGTLKAIGYDSNQIISSIILQFSSIALVGIIIGSSLSYLFVPFLSDMFAEQSALFWEQGFDIGINLFTLVFILGIVILTSYLAARRIKKLDPIIALRGGIVTHNFRKNHFPLEKTKAKLNLAISFKSIFNNLKQSSVILIIALAISFAGSFAAVMFYNTNVDVKAFKETSGLEIADITATVWEDYDSYEIIEEIRDLDGVRKTLFLDPAYVYIDGLEVVIMVMDDFSEREVKTIYEGRDPLHKNEIAINGYLARIIDKNIGDQIEVNYAGASSKYIITGFTQGSSLLGMNANMTTDGIRQIIPDFNQASLYIYLDDGVEIDEVKGKLDVDYKDILIGIIDSDQSFYEGAKSYMDIVSQMGIIIALSTFLVIILVLYFMISSNIIRGKRALGIQKSLGFTSQELMKQISLSFIIPLIIGVIIGNLLSLWLITPILSLVQSSMGMIKSNFIVDALWTTGMGLIIIVVSYFASLLISSKLKNISTYQLITE